jgi:glycosyltransferase involved in cell wall biosynthesis
MTNYEFPPLGGGAGNMTHGLAKRLVESGDEIDLLTMGSGGLALHEDVDGVSVVRVPTNRRDPNACTLAEAAQYLVRALPIMRELTRKRRYDLVHSHFVFPDGLLAMRVAGALDLPYVITAHGTDVPGHNPHRLRMLHAALLPLWRRVTTRAAAIVCPSNGLADKVTRANSRANVVVIPNAFDAARFRPNRQRQPRLLAVTRMIKLKGLQYLLAALHALGVQREVVLVGDGPYADELKSIARTLDVDVRFAGWLANDSTEFSDLYETSDIFVFPSEAENCPLVLLEAMAAGLPIITTTDQGCRGVVGDAAILVPPRDPTAIAGAISTLSSDEALRRRLGSAARRRVVEHFGWETLVSNYRTVYERYGR